MLDISKERAQEILAGIRAAFDDIMNPDMPKDALSESMIADMLDNVRLNYIQPRPPRARHYRFSINIHNEDDGQWLASGVPDEDCPRAGRVYDALRHAIWNLYYNVLEVARKGGTA